MDNKKSKKEGLSYEGMLADLIKNAEGKVTSGIIYYKPGDDGRIETILGHCSNFGKGLADNVKPGTLVKFQMGSYKNPKTGKDRLTAVKIKQTGQLNCDVLKEKLLSNVNFKLHVVKTSDIPLYLFSEGYDPHKLEENPDIVAAHKTIIGVTVFDCLVVAVDDKKPTFKILAKSGTEKVLTSKIFRHPKEETATNNTAKGGTKGNAVKNNNTKGNGTKSTETGSLVKPNISTKIAYVAKADTNSITTIGDLLNSANASASNNSAITVQK